MCTCTFKLMDGQCCPFVQMVAMHLNWKNVKLLLSWKSRHICIMSLTCLAECGNDDVLLQEPFVIITAKVCWALRKADMTLPCIGELLM